MDRPLLDVAAPGGAPAVIPVSQITTVMRRAARVRPV